MKMLAATFALSLGCCAGAAFAENDGPAPYDPPFIYQDQSVWLKQHPDAYGYAYDDYGRARAYAPSWRDNRAGLSDRDECWNPRAGHFEGVRPGDRQDDLDFSRCRPKAEFARGYRWR
jgi:hypothetical protein